MANIILFTPPTFPIHICDEKLRGLEFSFRERDGLERVKTGCWWGHHPDETTLYYDNKGKSKGAYCKNCGFLETYDQMFANFIMAGQTY